MKYSLLTKPKHTEVVDMKKIILLAIAVLAVLFIGILGVNVNMKEDFVVRLGRDWRT